MTPRQTEPSSAPLHPPVGSPSRRGRGAVHDRILAAADELFYTEGVQSVGIDRVVQHAGVAKASIYRPFGSKEKLVAEYLRARHASIHDELREAISRAPGPRERILAVFATQARWTSHSDYHGCAFTRAVAEPASGAEVAEATRAYRDEILELFTDLAAQTGVRAPDLLGAQLYLLYRAAAINDNHSAHLSAASRSPAETLIDAAVGG